MEATKVSLTVPDGLDVTRLTGPGDVLLRRIARETDARITVRGDRISIQGDSGEVEQITRLFSHLIQVVLEGDAPNEDDVLRALEIIRRDGYQMSSLRDDILLTYRGRAIRPKTPGQKRYIEAIRKHTVTICSGPAGTGKTYLAMAMAVAALKRHEVSRIVLTRPVVEAGESLGFLPGTLQEKVDPYVRPLYDALFDMTDMERGTKLIEQNIIEIAPLAYMRGRTLNDAFVILDEAQNTTPEQMKMFLTRLGFNSKFIITGDATQRDLVGKRSALVTLRDILGGIDDIAFVDLNRRDVVRHALVGRIVDAYDAYEKREEAAHERSHQ